MIKNGKKYKVVSISSTCEDIHHFNTIKEVKRYLSYRIHYTWLDLSAWDYELNDFVYLKFGGCSKAEIDLIFTNPKSDLRTKTRIKKEE